MKWRRLLGVLPHGSSFSIEAGVLGWGDAELEECAALYASQSPLTIVTLIEEETK